MTTAFTFNPALHGGWAGEKVAKDAWQAIGHLFSQFQIVGATATDDTVGKRIALYEIVRKVLGKDTLNYAQETGDCFLDGAPVVLADGNLCPIERIGAGEQVLSGEGIVRRVSSVFHKDYTGDLLTIAVRGGDPLPTCTPDHKWQLIDGTWLPASELKAGFRLKSAVDQAVSEFVGREVMAINNRHAKTTVRCIGVDEDHSFIVGKSRCVAHNCVSFGAKNVIEYLLAIQMFVGTNSEFHNIFPPYLYNIGRVLIGNNQLRGSQGSVGSWQAEAVKKFGSLLSDNPKCPKYSGAIANKWGDNKLDQEFYDIGDDHLVQDTAPINSWDQLRQANGNGYPSTIASNQGFEMTARSDGFHYPSGQWGHQMSIMLIDDNPKRSYGGLLNSWADVHGEIRDFETGEIWPKGMLRVRREVIEGMIRNGECFAYSNWQGFPAQAIDWSAAI